MFPIFSSCFFCSTSNSLDRRMRMAVDLFLCCERSPSEWTAMPVGIWVMRTADSVLLTCWPPAPRLRVVGRDPAQAMAARLRAQPAVGPLAVDADGGALDPRLVARLPVELL